MATTPLLDSQSGTSITYNDLINDPKLIDSLVRSLVSNEMIADAVLRDAGNNDSGVVRYRESEPTYADTDAQIRAEGAEVALAETSLGLPKVAYVIEFALGIKITDEMRSRQTLDPLQRQLVKVVNTMKKKHDKNFFNAILSNPNVNTYTCANTWSSTSAKTRKDIMEARRLVDEAFPAGMDYDSQFGFEADTMIIGKGSRADIMESDEYNKIYLGNIADENLLYTGKLPNQIFDLDVLVTSRMPAGKAIVMQRKMAGFYSDELPLYTCAPYRDEPRKMWRADTQRRSAVAIDQPQAITILNGVS